MKIQFKVVSYETADLSTLTAEQQKAVQKAVENGEILNRSDFDEFISDNTDEEYIETEIDPDYIPEVMTREQNNGEPTVVTYTE